MKYLLLMLISFNVSADWFVKANSPICEKKGSLDSYETWQAGEIITEAERISIKNECDFRPYSVRVNPQFYGVYSHAQAVNHKGNRKTYFVNTRDLEKAE